MSATCTSTHRAAPPPAPSTGPAHRSAPPSTALVQRTPVRGHRCTARSRARRSGRADTECAGTGWGRTGMGTPPPTGCTAQPAMPPGAAPQNTPTIGQTFGLLQATMSTQQLQAHGDVVAGLGRLGSGRGLGVLSVVDSDRHDTRGHDDRYRITHWGRTLLRRLPSRSPWYPGVAGVRPDGLHPQAQDRPHGARCGADTPRPLAQCRGSRHSAKSRATQTRRSRSVSVLCWAGVIVIWVSVIRIWRSARAVQGG